MKSNRDVLRKERDAESRWTTSRGGMEGNAAGRMRKAGDDALARR